MSNYVARRVTLVATVLGAAFVASACGARPAAPLGEPVILARPAPPAVTQDAPPPVVEQTQKTQPQDTVAPKDTGNTPIDPNLLEQAAMGAEPNTTLGAVVLDRTAGTELVSINADRQFSSASLVKLMIAIDTLHQGASAADREKLARMLSVSDDNLASSFWVVGGGAKIITRVSALVGLKATEPPSTTGQWGEVKLTAHDMVAMYQYVMSSLPPEDHTLIVDALAQAPQYAADDWDQYFGIPDGLNAQWAIKQGWGNNSKTMVLHSTGLVGAHWRYVVVLLTEHPLGSGWRTSEGAVTAAAAALNGHLPGA